MARSISSAALAVITAFSLLAPNAVRAQNEKAGDGFLFGKPGGALTIRLGYDRASANSDVYAVQRRDLTIGPRGFDGLTLGADFAFPVSPRIDLGFTIDGNTRSHKSEYRDWQDNTGQPINQQTTLMAWGGAVTARYNFSPRGRSISNFAWIPASYLPYVGVGGGLQYYELTQDGDFIDFGSPNKDVVSDHLHSYGFAPMGQGFVGLERNLTPHFALNGEARYTFSTGTLHQDYSELGHIDLSGLAFTLGTTIRF
jgi:hypothetical protein